MKTLIGLMLIWRLARAWRPRSTSGWTRRASSITAKSRPPTGQSKPVNTDPGGIIETRAVTTNGVDRLKSTAGGTQHSQMTAGPPRAAASPAVPVRGMDFDIYIRLQRGMTEGELLLRAGRPDHESAGQLPAATS